MGRKGPPPHCVGCERQRDDCRKTLVGKVCVVCYPMLQEVIRWQHEARFQECRPRDGKRAPWRKSRS